MRIKPLPLIYKTSTKAIRLSWNVNNFKKSFSIDEFLWIKDKIYNKMIERKN